MEDEILKMEETISSICANYYMAFPNCTTLSCKLS